MIDPAEFERRGLFDPKAPNAADRLALLRWLEERGISLEEMVDAYTRGRLTGLPADRALRPGERLDAQELAARAGVPIERIEQLRRVVGLGSVARTARVYTAEDVNMVQGFEMGTSVYGDRTIFQLLRTLGNGFARMAEAAVSLFLVDVEEPLMLDRGSEVDLARANLAACELVNQTSGVLDAVFRIHLEDAIRRSQQARSATRTFNTGRLAIGFIDLVGFTPLSRELALRDLATLIDDFETLGFDVAAEHDGRVVKLIGDEVMFVAPSAAAGCEIALTLSEQACCLERKQMDRPPLTPRGGIAVGELLTRGGDYYGPVVNLAARIADLAIPHEVLVTEEVRQEVGDAGLAFTPAGRRLLKGFAEPVQLFSASRR
jgi:adenylate cyclase